MSINRWEITGREEWLQRRRANINGSEVGALFGESHFITPYQLYAEKAGLVPLDDKDNKAMQRGRWQEPAVAAMIQDLHPEWQIEKCTEYFWSPEWRLGCTPDYWVTCPERGRGILQCKTVAKRIFENEWGEELPFWIVLQTLLEQMCTDVSWGTTGVAVRTEFDDKPFEFPFERHAKAEERIIVRAAEFWAAVKAGVEPKPNYAEDGEIIRAVFPRDNGTTIDLSGDNRLPELLEAFETLSADEKSAAKELKAVKAEIAAKLGDAAAASLPGWQVSMKTVERAGYEVKPTSFRQLRVKRTEERQAAA